MTLARSFAAAAVALALSSIGAEASAQSARIASSSVGIEPKQFQARVAIDGDPGNKVAKVVFSLTPRCAADPSTSKYGAVPEVVASTASTEGGRRIFTATIPDPSGGQYGAWTVRSTAMDAAGAVVGRHQSVVVRAFEPKFKTLAFEVPAGKGGAEATLDTSSGPQTAKLVVDLDHDAPITSFGLVTSSHDNPAIGYSSLPRAISDGRAQGATPWLTSRLEQTKPTTIVGHFGLPASTPAMKVTVQRILMVDARCRTADLAPRSPLSLALSSKAPRAMPVDVRLDKAAFAKGNLAIGFRLIGPAPRTAPSPDIGGAKAPIVAVSFLDNASPPKVLGTTNARPVAGADKKWDGESMVSSSIELPKGPTALGEALKKGLQIEIDDGGKPLAPKAVVRAP
jgi:hypothetical protein